MGVVLGAAVLGVLRPAVIFLEISTYWTLAVITGLVPLGTMIMDAVMRRRRS